MDLKFEEIFDNCETIKFSETTSYIYAMTANHANESFAV